MKIPQYIIDKYGKSIEAIHKSKSEGKQFRTFAVTAPEKIVLSAKECQELCEKSGIKYRKHDEDRILRYIFSDESVDRMGDIIRASGWQLTNYRNNPVILVGHDSRSLPIGAGLNLKAMKKQLTGNVLFASEELSEQAEKAFKLAEAGFFRASSVGFMPIDVNVPDDKEREKLGLGPWGVEFKKQELLEHSLVSVPANPAAVQDSISKGLIELDFFKDFYDDEIYDKLCFDVTGKKSTIIKSDGEDPPAEDPAEDSPGESTFNTEDFKKAVAKEVAEILGEKAGAVLSKKNRGILTKVTEVLESAVTDIKDILDNAKDEPQEDDVLPDGTKIEDFDGSDDDEIADIDYSTINENA